MAPATNWLSFSLSPMEMLRSESSSESPHFVSYDSNSSPHYLLDNFYVNGWGNTKQAHHQVSSVSTMSETAVLTSFIDQETAPLQVPKLEDFLGDSSSIVRYSDNSQTETQDSSLTHIYDHHHHHQHHASYFNEKQDLTAITGYQAFSTNSGSEVDDSASIGRAQIGGGEFVAHYSVESSGTELGFRNGASNGLSLAVNNINDKSNNGDNNMNNNHHHRQQQTQECNDKAIVSVGSDSTKKLADTFGQRTSIYRGVTRHRWTGRYEAHLWDNSCRREGQARKGRQVYLGGYDKEEKAARAYDLAALKYWGPTATTNFPVSNYSKELEEMKYVSKQEFIASLRRKSSGFSRGASIYRGVTRHHQQGRWQARIGRVAGNKDLYLGTFATEQEAAEAYDIAAIKFRGMNAVTNFEMSRYDVEAIMNSALPVGGAAKRLKLSIEAEQKPALPLDEQPHYGSNGANNISFAALPNIPCGIPFEAAALYHQNSIYHHIQNANHYAATDSSGSTSSMAAAPLGVMPQTAEFYIWPHQSY